MSHNNLFIPLSVVEEILLNLDAQTLIQCAFLCKDWNSLITSPDFISRHSNGAIDSRKEVLLIRHWLPRDDPHLRFKDTYFLHLDNDHVNLFWTAKSPTINGWEGKTVGTSNGLVCLADYPANFLLWNPTIQISVCLPRLKSSSLLASNGHDFDFGFGFGFDHGTNDFKVVSLAFDRDKVESAWVFSYLNWSWKHVTNSTPPPCHLNDMHRSPVLINGALHWSAYNKVGNYDFVLKFDLAREVFGQILLPWSIRDGSLSIAAAGDSSIAVSSRRTHPWTVWIMTQYGVHESWANTVITSELFPKDVLYIRKDGDIILDMRNDEFITPSCKQILRYNPSTSETNVLGGIKELESSEDAIFIGYHAENLYLLDKGEDVKFHN